MKKVRVLHLLGSLNTGGAENLVLDLISFNNSTLQEVDFHIVYMHKSDANRVELYKNNASNLKYIECGKGVKTLKFIKNLREYILTNRISLIHCHNNIDFYWAKLATRKFSKADMPQIILSIHGLNLNLNFFNKKISKIPLGKKIFNNLLDNKLLENCRITYVSQATKGFYIEKYGKTIPALLNGEVIYNGILPTKILDAKPKILDDNILPHTLLMGMVGNFNTTARLQLMVCKALAQLPKDFKFKFYFVGERNVLNPELFDSCVKFCKGNNLEDKVIFTGKRGDVPQLMKGWHLYVYGSAADTFGISVVEAVMAGVPVICSDIPALREVLLNGQLGELVFNSPQAFAYAIQKHNFNECECSIVDKQEVALMKYSIKTTFESFYSYFL